MNRPFEGVTEINPRLCRRSLSLAIENLVVRARSEFNGYAVAGDIAENPKHEIRNPKQSQMTKTQMIQIIGLSTVVHTASFGSLDHWVFELVSYFHTRIWYKRPQLSESSLLGLSQSRVLWGRILYAPRSKLETVEKNFCCKELKPCK